MKKSSLRRILIWTLLIIYVICIVILLFLQFFQGTHSAEQDRLGRSRLHGLLSLTGVTLCGVGMITYRVFDGVRTRIVKYLHLTCQTLATVCLFIGYVFAASSEGVFTTVEENKDGTRSQNLHITSRIHIVIGYMLLAGVALQLIVASLIFSYLYTNKKLRHVFAPFHDIFGVWIYVCLVATYLSGLHFLYDPEGYWKSEAGASIDPALSYLCFPAFFGFLIPFVVAITPYFEWKLVGPL